MRNSNKNIKSKMTSIAVVVSLLAPVGATLVEPMVAQAETIERVTLYRAENEQLYDALKAVLGANGPATTSDPITKEMITVSKLASVNFTGKGIKSDVGFNILKHSQTLQFVTLTQNELTSFDASALPSQVRQLILSSNKLTSFDASKVPASVYFLYLDGNQLTSFDGSAMPDAVEELVIRRNNLTTFIGKNTGKLKRLDLGTNQLTSFNSANLPGTISEILLNDNKFTSFDPSLLPNSLTRLFLGNNQISVFDASVLPQNLSSLHVDYNGLEDFRFSKLPSLLNLNLSGNKLTKLEHSLPGTLEYLNLSYNEFGTIEDVNLSEGIKDVNLSFNKIKSIDEIPFPSSVTAVNLNGNQIESFDPTKLPSSLITLQLDNNIIGSVDTGTLPRTLKTLQLEGNRLTEIDASSLPSLTGLSLRDNAIPLNLPLKQMLDGFNRRNKKNYTMYQFVKAQDGVNILWYVDAIPGGTTIKDSTNIVLPKNATGEFVYNVQKEGSYTFTGYSTTPMTVTVPAIFFEKPVITLDSENPATDVKVSIEYPMDSVTKEYRLGVDGEWKSYTGAFVVGQNTTVYARSSDEAGNMSDESSYAITNIDQTAPDLATFSADNTELTNGNVMVTVNYPADASQREYKIGESGVWTAYTTPVVVTKNDTIYARSKDQVGNISAESSYMVSNIDKDAPEPATFTTDKTAPTNGKVVVTVSYPADAIVKEYKIGASGTWIAYTTSVEMTSNDTVYARSKDEAGNISTESSYDVSNIDNVVPTLTLMPSIMTPTNQDVRVEVTVDEAESGVSILKFAKGLFSVGYFASNGSVVSDNSFTASSNGVYTVYVRDLAGNEGVQTINIFNIDKVSPTAPTLSQDKNVITIQSGTDGEGVKETLVKINNGGWNVYTTALTLVDGEYDIQAKTVDLAGNESIIATSHYNIYEKALQTSTDEVMKAEQLRTQQQVDKAKQLVEALPNIPEKTQLVDRLKVVQDQIDADKAVQDATQKVTLAEQTKKQLDIDTAREAVNALPDNVSKQALLDRLDAIVPDTGETTPPDAGDEMSNEEVVIEIGKLSDLSAKKSFSDILKAVERAEGNPTNRVFVQLAWDKVKAVPDSIKINPTTNKIYNNLYKRAEKLKNDFNAGLEQETLQVAIKKATDYVISYEKYKIAYYKAKAQEAVNELPAGETKTALQARIDAVVMK